MSVTNIDKVIQDIAVLFNNFGRDDHAFTVDYDDVTDGLYCNYAPYPNDEGYAVSDDLLTVTEMPQSDLRKLKSWLKEYGISSRAGCEWDFSWGYT